jgi:regulator of ribonuclease activity A
MHVVTADLVDAHAAAVRSCNLQFRSYGGVGQFCGAVRTIRTCEDNLLVRQLLSQPGANSVLVVDGGGSLRTALVGDAIARLAYDNAWQGLVIRGAVRDCVALGAIGLGIKALGTNPWKSGKQGVGEIDVAVTFGDVTFAPGQWLYSDEDGLLVADSRLPTLPDTSR